MNAGTYLVKVFVNGNLIPSYQYVNGIDSAQLIVNLNRLILWIECLYWNSFKTRLLQIKGIGLIYSENKWYHAL